MNRPDLLPLSLARRKNPESNFLSIAFGPLFDEIDKRRSSAEDYRGEGTLVLDDRSHRRSRSPLP